MPTFPFSEKHLSQIPALQQLINLGYQYLPPAQAMTERGGLELNIYNKLDLHKIHQFSQYNLDIPP